MKPCIARANGVPSGKIRIVERKWKERVLLFEAHQKIVFIGDSITDCGRRDEAAPYGNGYVSLVRNLLLARYPEQQLTIVNKGIGGNTTRDLAARWKKDVILEQP